MIMRKQSNWVEEKSLESMRTKLNNSLSSVQYNPIHRSNSFCKKPNSSLLSTNNNSMITLQPFLQMQPSQEVKSTKGTKKIEYNAINVKDRKIIREVSSKLNKTERIINDYSSDSSLILSQMKVTKILVPLKARIIEHSFSNRDSSDSSPYSSFRRERKQSNTKLLKYHIDNNKKQTLYFTNRSIALHRRQLSSFKDHLHNIIERSSQVKKSQYFFNKNIKGFICSDNGNKRKINQSSTLLIKTNVVKNNVFKRLLLNNNSSALTSTIRLQSLTWLWSNKTLLLERLILSYKTYKWFLEKNKLMSPKIMSEFMSLLKIEKDDEFIEGVFLIFDSNQIGTVNIQEVFLFFILTSSSSYEINISHILDLLIDENRSILLYKLIELLKFALTKANLKKISQILHSRFAVSQDQLETPGVSFNLLYSFLITDPNCIKIIKRKMSSYTTEDSNLEQEIVSACVSNMKNSLNCLSDHSTKMFRVNDFNKFNHILNSIQICRNERKKHRYISSEEGKKSLSD